MKSSEKVFLKELIGQRSNNLSVQPPTGFRVNSRRPTICPPSPSLPRINPCPSLVHLSCTRPTHHDCPGRVILLRPSLLVPQSPHISYGRDAPGYIGSRILASN